MSYTLIPLQDVANQTLDCVLDDNVPCTLNLATTDYGLFIDIVYGGAQIANARLCQDRTNLTPYAYLGVPQALFFADTQGTSDPASGQGLGSRFLLCYGSLGQG